VLDNPLGLFAHFLRCYRAKQNHSVMSLEVTDLRLSQRRLEEELRENGLALETAKDRELELGKDLDSTKVKLEQLKIDQAAAVSEDRDKRKADMLSDMMAKIDTVSRHRFM
jgi:hypothetical protein